MFLLIDKPIGWSSFKVVHRLRRRLGVKRVGHAGTLDPLATGLLLLACGRSTKVLEYLFGLNKTYLVTVMFGLKSDTYDFEGQIVEGDLTKLPKKQTVLDLLPNFTGKIQQVPPVYSAVKVKGRAAYELARAGKPPVLSPKEVEIFQYLLVSWGEQEYQGKNYPMGVFLVECSKGTYVRTLAHDLGEKLGCAAVVRSLRRTAVGPFSVDDERVISGMLLDDDSPDSFERFKENLSQFVVPAGELFADFPRIDLSERAYEDISVRRSLRVSAGAYVANQLVAAFYKGEMVAMLRMKGHFLAVEKVIA